MINLFLITFLACGDDEETDTSKLEVENPQEEVVEESTEEVSIDSGEGGCATNAAVPEFLPQAETDPLLEQVKSTANVNDNTCKS